MFTLDDGDDPLKRKTIVTATLIASMAFITTAAHADGILYARYPALSPDGSTIAFTYMGDIWTVPASGGEARRLTVHEGEDICPFFSPDGRTILFSSRRYNNYDLFVIPADGGPARQLTFHTADDIGSGWFARGDSVLFASGRNESRDIYKISIAGGTPVELTGYRYEQEFNGRVSSDGKHLVYNNGSALSNWWRRDMKSGRNTDIFLLDRAAETFTSRRLTDFPGYDTWPVLNEDRDEIYFVSCRSDWAQIWKISLSGGEAVPLTEFTGDGVQWLNSNPQGTMLVFEQDFGIWIMDPVGGRPRRIPIQIRSDERDNLVERKSFDGNIEWYALSPDGRKIAAVIHGEIFIIPAEKPKEGRRITFTPSREQYPAWGSDSKTLYYSSDRNGSNDIYAADAATGRETRLSSSPENEVKPQVSPDGKYLAFYRGLDKIIRMETDGGSQIEWVKGIFSDLGVEPTLEYNWSPDSKWLAFTMAGPTYETDIYIVPIEGQPKNVSLSSGSNFRPRFSDDGKIIYYSSAGDERFQTVKIDLAHKPTEFLEARLDSLFRDTVRTDSAGQTPSDSILRKPATVTIDFDRIEKRRTQAYRLETSSFYPVLTPDGRKFIFIASILGRPEIWSVNTEDDPELKQLTHSGKDKSNLTVTADSKAVIYLEEGRINRTELSEDKTTTLAFTATIDVDIRELNRQKMFETWQMLNSYFYDKTFHGADWDAALNKYTPVLDHIRTEPEFRNLVREMMGELRASHLNIYSREPGPDAAIVTGETGITFDYRALDREGRYRIARIIPESPADLAGLRAGQYITAVNGTALSPETDFDRLLAGTIDHRVTLAAGDNPDRPVDTIAVKPISSDSLEALAYFEWVHTRRQMVDSLSQGRLAYIHVPGMSERWLRKFREELVAVAEPKDGLIIDVRDNGGGSVAVHLLDILERAPFVLRTFRDFPPTSESKMRSKALEKPMTLLINNYSGSNSEIFAEGFRRLKLGKIIGEPTGGGVIGTSSYPLIDGTVVRRPSWGAFTIGREDTDLAPRNPDVFVENLPDDFINGRDPQLIRAVQELIKELK